MSQELSYVQLKTANEARQAEEVRLEHRKRTLLVLILHYLRDEGYLDAARVLEREGGTGLMKYEVCDNVDLPNILQEYESYYYVKFNKQPKIIKKSLSSDSNKCLPPKLKSLTKSSRNNSVSLPSISNTNGESTPQSAGSASKRPSSDGKRKPKLIKQNSSSAVNSPPEVTPQSSSTSLNLSGTSITTQGKNALPSNQGNQHGKQVIVDMRAMLNNAIKGDYMTADNDPSNRLLKPVGGFAGLTGEWRDLASVISRDIYLHDPDVRWDDIIGLDAAKRLVKEAVVYPIKYPQLFSGILSPWKGLLLYGPPGTGKTLLAKAVATECNTTFFNISASSIVSKWRGDSEKLVRVLFELARFHAPSTIFLDELESLMGQRGAGGGGSEHEGSRRMKTELLVQMDGLARSDDLVFLLAASNLPWELDHAMLRRLEKRILVDLPIAEARKAMLKQYLPPVIAATDENGVDIRTEIDYETLAQKTDGYSGSDMKLLCKEAAMRKVRKIFDILEGHHPENVDGRATPLPKLEIEPVTNADMEAALAHTKPSARQLRDKYKEWQKEYESV
ncbi:katanin p60 ATPase-containing subunit A-like 2 isoform X2 [Actinia tenebrosa]|uniref:Katanin p60 ATPase-containing subunit A-like 2 n=1 Tax=Actinia tenebrosa TaxID=6105 RepID=A0A6P8IDS6_ACTTE|nr:katanin p60 ATPase-containing subunit A-like 2 isoform X2 [Actinia tenebrosa]